MAVRRGGMLCHVRAIGEGCCAMFVQKNSNLCCVQTRLKGEVGRSPFEMLGSSALTSLNSARYEIRTELRITK